MAPDIPGATSPVTADEHVVLLQLNNAIAASLADNKERSVNDSLGSTGGAMFLGREQAVDPATRRAQVLEAKERRRIGEDL